MRMWIGIEPKQLCGQHLLGEHNEIHKALGNLNNSRTWAESLTKDGYLEPQNFQTRHDELAEEMLRRGYKHNSPLIINGTKLPVGHVNRNRSLSDLLNRCKECEERIVNEND